MSYNTMMMFGTLAMTMYSACASPEPGLVGATDGDPPDDPGAEVDAGVVLRVDVEAGHAVTFYEPAPGGLYLVERMVPGQRFALGDAEMVDAQAAFARLRPDDAMPAALEAAYLRTSKPDRSEPATRSPWVFGGGEPAQAPNSTSGVVQQALTSSSSAANFVNNDQGCAWGREGSGCLVNWANGFWASLSPTTSGVCVVDHYAGNGITVQITAVGIIPPVTQLPNTIVQYSLGMAGGPPVARRIDILNASGDSFHVGCRWGI